MATTAIKPSKKLSKQDRKQSAAIETTEKQGRITLELVQKIGYQVGEGLTLEQALLLEPEHVESRTFQRAIAKHPLFRRAYESEQARFVRESITTIKAGDTKDCRKLPGLIFLLERRHKNQFGRESSVSITNNILSGVPLDMMSQLRDRANRLSRGSNQLEAAPETYYARKKRERLAARALVEQQGKVIDVQEVKPEVVKVEK